MRVQSDKGVRERMKLRGASAAGAYAVVSALLLSTAAVAGDSGGPPPIIKHEPPPEADLAPDGTIRPGTPSHAGQKAAAAEAASRRADAGAAAQSLAPRAAAIARQDPRLAEVLRGADDDRTDALPIADGNDGYSGARVTFRLADPVDFFFDFAQMDSDVYAGVGALRMSELRVLWVFVDVVSGTVVDVAFVEHGEATLYDLDGREVGRPADPEGLFPEKEGH